MEDIFKSIKAYLYDRTTSPLIGAYIIAWSIWNYRIFIIFFGADNQSATSKFNDIDAVFKSFDLVLSKYTLSINGALYHGLLIPAILTSLYIYAYPILAKPVYEHSLRKQKELRVIKQAEENNRLLTVEESREIYKRLSDVQTKHAVEVESYTKQISALNQIINDLESKSPQEIDQTESTDNSKSASTEEFDNEINAKVELMDEREFQLSDLFDNDKWKSLGNEIKQSLGKRFKMKVERGDFVGVKKSRKGTGNQIIYIKEPIAQGKQKLNDEANNIMDVLNNDGTDQEKALPKFRPPGEAEIKNPAKKDPLERFSQEDKILCREILKQMVQGNKDSFEIKSIAEYAQINLQKTLFIKDVLAKIGFVDFNPNSSTITLTSEGRSYLYDEDLLA